MKRRRFEFVTFDCYGTLIDWERGIAEAMLSAAQAAGQAIPREALLAAYAEIEPRVQAGAFRAYREVLGHVASRVARRFGWELSVEAAGFLARSLPQWRAFDDSGPALRRLQDAGYRLGVLSNVDDDLLQATLAQFDVTFDLLVTAQQVQAYKPSPAHFESAARTIGGAPWLHAAQSYFHDIVPATRRHIPVAWINRQGERPAPDGPQPREFPDLARLADWLCREGVEP